MNSLFLNKKALLFLFVAAAINFCFPANAGIFCDNGSFQMAKAVKLGRGNAYSVGGQAELAGKTELIKEKPCDKNCVSCDKTTGTCSKCASGYYLYENACHTCPQYATCDGSDDFSCPAPQYFKIDLTCYKCSDTIEHCIACSDATKCTECESPYVVSDTGDSCIEPPTCATAAMQNNTNVAAATDASSFYAAMDSGKSVILIDGDISGLATTALGSKKLVGPKYFSDIEICKTQTTPTVTFASSSNMTISGGEINQLNLKFTLNDKSKNAVSGSGIIKDSTISAHLSNNVVSATGKITLSGDVTILSEKDDGDNYANQGVLATEGGTIEIAGKTTLKGESSYGLRMGKETTVTINSSGTLILNMPGVFVGIDLENGSTFTANGPVKFEQPASSSAIGYISVYESYINLNANGNYLKTTYAGLMETSGMIKVNGSTTIECFKKQNNSTCTAINVDHTYGGTTTKLEINAPVTVKGLTKDRDNQYPTISGDMLLYAKGDSIKLNSTIESTTGIGKVFINVDSANFTSSGAIIGANYMYGYERPMNISAGAKLKMNGVCKKATSSGTMTLQYDNGITTPIAPFTGGC